MLNKIYKIGFVASIAILPLFASAFLEKTEGILTSVAYLLTSILIPIVFSLALLFFFFGVAKFIWGEGQGKEDGKKIMIWGIVGLFVMSSVWGIVRFVQSEVLGNSGTGSMPIPTIGG